MSLLLVLAMACASGETPAAPAPQAPTADAPAPTADTTPTNAPAAPTDAPAVAPAASSLPDLSVGLETGSCGNGPGNEGADSHFLGQFKVSGSSVSGTERWLLHANSKLASAKLWTGGTDCEVRWMIRGVTTAPRHCGDCDLGIQLTATVDKTGSTCPEDMVDREESFEVGYDVRRGADGVAYFYFAKSGKLLGQGYHQGDTVAYVTQHQCKWF